MLCLEGFTDRQAADAVHRGMDGKDALSRECTASGVDITLWHDVRCQILTPEAGERRLDTYF